jgi:hypothetical protein
MQHVRRPITRTSPTNRSKLTNGTGLLAGVDSRSTEARRYRDLVCIFAAEFNIQTDADLARVETAAALKFQLEALTSTLVRGERVDQGEMARLSTELRHVLSDLKGRAAAGPACCEGAPVDGNGAYAAVICEEEEDD